MGQPPNPNKNNGLMNNAQQNGPNPNQNTLQKGPNPVQNNMMGGGKKVDSNLTF